MHGTDGVHVSYKIGCFESTTQINWTSCQLKKIGRREAESNFFQLTASPINFVVDEECIQFCDYYVRTMLQNERK